MNGRSKEVPVEHDLERKVHVVYLYVDTYTSDCDCG